MTYRPYDVHLARRDEQVHLAAETAARYRMQRDQLNADPSYSEEWRTGLIERARTEAAGKIDGYATEAAKHQQRAVKALDEVPVPGPDPADRARVAAALAAGRRVEDLIAVAGRAGDAATLLALRAEVPYLAGPDVEPAGLTERIEQTVAPLLGDDVAAALATRRDAARSWAGHEIALNVARTKLDTGPELGDVIAQRLATAPQNGPAGAEDAGAVS